MRNIIESIDEILKHGKMNVLEKARQEILNAWHRIEELESENERLKYGKRSIEDAYRNACTVMQEVVPELKLGTVHEIWVQYCKESEQKQTKAGDAK